MRHYTIIISVICLMMVIAHTAPVHSSKDITVEGLIQNVSYDSIQVLNKIYGISGVILKDNIGRIVSTDKLKTGIYVKIVFDAGKIAYIELDIEE
jgi:hypothetical protein